MFSVSKIHIFLSFPRTTNYAITLRTLLLKTFLVTFTTQTLQHSKMKILLLGSGELEYKLKFNCKPCEMEIWEKDAEFEIEEDHFH